MPRPAEFELVRARLTTHDEDVTPAIIGWLAFGSGQWEGVDDRTVIEYRYRGTGPFAIYFDPGETPIFPPLTVDGIKAVDDVVIMAESNKDEIDVTDAVNMFGGPDGKFGGRLDDSGLSWGTFDPKLLHPSLEKGDSITISYANGKEVELIY